MNHKILKNKKVMIILDQLDPIKLLIIITLMIKISQ